ncbi:hypothetical protein [Nocardioides marmorisolisilvae]|uniref:Uncharacterized protein n=1 Tax=Nocardioides marmorisolisilvae TaxID=1542737 RepID=A0A3N0DQJ8_9ACTN|nr:hypothetical protein [Nocardioides marmorisolisilvae]RNL77771.1 hypothetical protein EFL95_17415 [Nocardioides marmorisolisilvae]
MRDPSFNQPRVVGPVDHPLERLFADIERSRQVLRHLLDSRKPGSSIQVLEAREESRAALERFVATLVAHQLPVPRRINDELALVRRLCAHARAPYRKVLPPEKRSQSDSHPD